MGISKWQQIGPAAWFAVTDDRTVAIRKVEEGAYVRYYLRSKPTSDMSLYDDGPLVGIFETLAAAKRGAGGRRARVNPGATLAILGANPGEVIGTNVDRVFYTHATEGARVHRFRRGVRMEGLSDGSIRLWSPKGDRLWGDL